MKAPRIPGKHVVWFKGRPIVMNDTEYRAFVDGMTQKPKKGKRK